MLGEKEDAEVSEVDRTLEACDINQRYGKCHAIAGFSLRIERGQVHGLLAPNGSSKTTSRQEPSWALRGRVPIEFLFSPYYAHQKLRGLAQ